MRISTVNPNTLYINSWMCFFNAPSFICFILLFSLAFLAPKISVSQTFHRIYKGVDDEVGTSVRQTSDGGFIITGFTKSSGAGASDLVLIKTNANGETEWTKTFGGSGSELAMSVRQTSDGGYVAVGFTTSFGVGGLDIYMVKTDSNGDEIWTRTFGNSTMKDSGYDVEQTSDGGYIVTGTTDNGPGGFDDLYLIKIDSAGDEIWSKMYGGDFTETGHAVRQTTDGGYIVAGVANAFGPTAQDVYLLRTDADGDTLWTRTFSGPSSDIGQAVVQTSDGGFMVGAFTSSFSNNVYLIRTDASGDTLWTKIIDDSAEQLIDMQQTSDGGFIIAGNYQHTSTMAFQEAYLLKTDSDGNVVWAKSYGTQDADFFGNSVQQTSNGGYVLVGSREPLWVPKEIFLLRTDANGSIGGCGDLDLTSTHTIVVPFVTNVTSGALADTGTFSTWPIITQGTGSPSDSIFCIDSISTGVAEGITAYGMIKIYPNPANNDISIEINAENNIGLEIKIIDITGVVIYKDYLEDLSVTNVKQLNLSGISSGIYFIQLQGTNILKTERLIVY